MAHIVDDAIVKGATAAYAWPSYSYSELAELRLAADKGDPLATVRLTELPLPERRLARHVVDAFLPKGKKKKRRKVVCSQCGAMQNPAHNNCPECGSVLPADAPRADEFEDAMSKKKHRRALRQLTRYERRNDMYARKGYGWERPAAVWQRPTDAAIRQQAVSELRSLEPGVAALAQRVLLALDRPRPAA